MENQKENVIGDQKAMSPEEMTHRRVEMMNFYQTQMPLLTLQKEYETLAADIEEARARRMRAVIMMGQMTAPPSNEVESDEPTDDTAPTRKLKTK